MPWVLSALVAHELAVGAEPEEIAQGGAVDDAALEPAPAMQHRVAPPECDQAPRELEQRGSLGARGPVEPGELVVLTVRVVVAALGAVDLVTAEQHGHALGQQQRGEPVALLALAEAPDGGILGLAFHAAIPGAIVRLAVLVALPVRVVVLVVVRHQIVQREAVVGGHEIDARVGLAAVALVEVGAAGESIREVGEPALVAPPVVAHGVAVATVPLRPQDREVADLVPAFADVPRLGDQLHLAHDRILLDDVEERRQPIDVVQLPGERRSEVEAEAVDVHLRDPVAQAVHQELEDVRMAHVQAIAAAGVVHAVARRVGDLPVVGRVVDPAEGERRAQVIPLGGVVVDHVEDHLDAGGMERAHHGLELSHRRAIGAAARIGVVGREEPDRIVAPVVAQPPTNQRVLSHELMDGQQLDGRHAERQQMLDRRWARQPRERPALVGGHRRMRGGEALHVDLVHDRLVPGGARRPIAGPVERRVDDDGARRERRAVVVVPPQIRGGIAEPIAVQRLVPYDITVDGAGVGVEQQLARVEAMSLLRRERPMDAIAVALARTDPGDVAVPAVRRDFRQHETRLGAGRVEQAELDAIRVLGEEREVRPLGVWGRAERIRPARPHRQPRHHAGTSR